jgi:aminoglycoside phosphotransferase family enzyme/predicted kinase
VNDWTDVADWLAARADETIETSCARVFLTGDHAWKIKKPVDYGFLDFSSLEKRRVAIERELELNRRWSPDIYRAVRKIARTDGDFQLDGDGVAVEWLLEMRRFDPSAVLDGRPEEVDATLAEAIGRLVGRAHVDAPTAVETGDDAYLYTVESNVEALRRSCPPLNRDVVETVIAKTRAGREALRPLLEARRTAGYRRLCHGDLHLGNILLENGAPVPFDCIEFNDVLGRMDIAYDAAFPIMDLCVRGRAEAANAALNAWLDEAARGFPPSLWDGLAALPQFLCVRACVRAHVMAHSGEDDMARRYLDAAEGFISPPSPCMTAIGGYSGSGKTVEAARRAAATAPGALHLRTDLIRKRLWNAGPRDPLPDEAYGPAEDERTHRELFDIARRALFAGWPVILDATFLDPARRTPAEALAAEAGVPFEGVWMEAPPEVLRDRLAKRRDDASDADVAVLERQLAHGAGTVTWQRSRGGLADSVR